MPQTGSLGPATRRALKIFQSRQQLGATGVLDRRTVAALKDACGGGSSRRTVEGSRDRSSSATAPDTEQELSEVNRGALPLRSIRTALRLGIRDQNRLTDIAFYALHPERRRQPLRKDEQRLIREWLMLRDRVVVPALHAASAPATPAAAGQAPAQSPSSTSGVEAAGNTTHIIPCISELQDQGRPINFVQRYLRDLTVNEIQALHQAGLVIVSCFEEGTPQHNATQLAYFTRAQGQRDGRRAFTQAQAVGQPAGRPVYFAVDTDPSNAEQQAILDYFEGIAEGHRQYLADMKAQNKPATPYTIGVYGSGCVLSWCQAQAIATWFWQAFAPGWCNNQQVWPGANIRTSGLDQPTRCGWRLGHLEGWGNEGAW